MTPFSSIKFNKKHHTYTLNGRRLPSVTTLINQLKPPFDRDYWSQKKADERGVPVQTILDEWDAKRQAGQDRGNRIHQYIQRVLLGMAPVDDPFLSLNDRLPEMDGFDAFWSQIFDETTLHRTEWIIGESELNVAGTADALLFSHQTNRYHPWDWKTGDKFRTDNPFQKLLPPFDDLDDCELVTYSLQISIYRLILRRNTVLDLGDSYILHLSEAYPTGYHVYKAIDFCDRAQAWLQSLVEKSSR